MKRSLLWLRKMTHWWLCLGLLLFINYSVYAEYRLPDNEWQKLLNAQSPSSFALSPDGRWLLQAHEQVYQSLSDLSQPRLSLAGLTFALDQATPLPVRQYDRITLINAHDDRQQSVALPDGASVVDFVWSPDSRMLALILKTGSDLRLHRYHLASGSVEKWGDLPVSARLGNNHVFWLPDSQSVLLRAAPPAEIRSADDLPSPKILETASEASSTRLRRAYRNLLDTEVAQQNFRTLVSQRLWQVTLSGNSRPVTEVHMIELFSISPDGRYVLIKSLSEELANDVNFPKLGRVYRIYSMLDAKKLAGLPELAAARQARSKDAVAVGARLAHWLPGEPATLVWAEAQDGGDMERDVAHHDGLHIWRAPFNAPQGKLLDIEWRLYDINWTTGGRAVFYSWRAADQQLRTWTFHLTEPVATKQLIQQRNYKDSYSDIGDAGLVSHPQGYSSITANLKDEIYFFGKGQAEHGRMPFVERYSFSPLKKQRIFQSASETLESPLYVLPAKSGESVLFRQESPTLPPRLMKRDGERKDPRKDQLLKPLQERVPDALASKPELIRYKRADGVELHGKLYLPADSRTSRRKYPAVIWLYPAEFTDKAISEQLNIATNEYVSVEPLGPLPLLLDQVAVFEASTMPILGDGKNQPNDSYSRQLIANAEATVEALKATGVIDTDRLAVMGHSYGAASVANLLANTDLFKAGIARSGAYNRTLTPLGFQGELRNLWEAPSTYITMSPFMAANKINEPLLLIHGSADQNPGTMPLQSEMLYLAIQANGGTARLVMLPNEDHAYHARENVLHLLWEQSNWVRKWLIEQELSGSAALR